MEYYNDLAEMYVGNDVSPDFYAWVFPKCDHVAVGTGTVCAKQNIKLYQKGIRERVKHKISGGKVIKVEAHPIPEHPRPIRIRGRVALVGDAAGYVTKCSGEGIYFAAKSGRMCGEAIVKASEGGDSMVNEDDLKREYLRVWDSKYVTTFRFLDLLQRVFYGSNAAREALVELCDDEYVQRMTFESYLYKKLADGDRLQDVKMVWNTIGSLIKCNMCDHVAVGTGTVCAKQNIKLYQKGIRERVKHKISGGKVIKVEAHPIPEHPRPIRIRGRVALVGDAAGYVTKCSGEGIYFAAKSGRMCGEAIVKASEGGDRMVNEDDLKREYLRVWDSKYVTTFRFLDLLQRVFYGSNAAREALVELCDDEYVQRMTFESYLYKKLADGDRLQDVKMVWNTIGSLIKCNMVGSK
nr:geranylgeranyl diphosphate reductase, chloroplastic [Quercus suber]